MQSDVDPDDDDISLTSTVDSEPQEEYEVDCIYAQKTFDDGERYLVQWTGYPLERCTWELAENFMNPRTLEDWEKTKEEIANGEKPSFDYAGMIKKVDEFNAARDEKKRRRRAKRLRLGLPTSPDREKTDDSSDSNMSDFIADDDDDGIDRNQSRKRGTDAKKRPEQPKSSSKKALPRPDTSSSGTQKQSTVPRRESPVRTGNENQSSKTGFSKEKPERPKLTLQTQHSPANTSVATKSATSATGKSMARRTTASVAGPAPNSRGRKLGQDLNSIIREKAKNTASTSNQNPALFKNLSTQNRYAKARRRELAPNINQLDLRKPEDWAKPSAPLGSFSRRDDRRDTDSLFVEQDSPPRPSANDNISPDNQTPTSGNAECSAPTDPAYSRVWSPDPPSRRSSLGGEKNVINSSGDVTFSLDSYRPGKGNQSLGTSHDRYDSYRGSAHPGLTRQSSDTWRPQQSSGPSTASHQYQEGAPSGSSVSPQSPQHSPRIQGSSKWLSRPDNRRAGLSHGPRKFRAFNHRFEALVRLRFKEDGQTIGDAKFCGLSRHIILQLLSTKARGVIDMHFRDTCNRDEYNWMCNQTTYNTIYSNGWVDGYDDTSGSLNEMAGYLKENGLAALWYHPGEDNQHQPIIIAYPKGSPQWESLCVFSTDRPSSATLLLAARAPFSPQAFAHPAPPPAPRVQNPHTNIEPQPEYSTVMDEPGNILPSEDVTMADAPAIEPATMSLPNTDNVDIVAMFRDQLGIHYSQLIQFGSEKKDPRKPHPFYLHFPESDSASAEYQVVKLFLGKFNTILYDNRAEGDWGRFVGTLALSSGPGTILFHESFVNYQDIPRLSHWLRQRLNVFNISLAQPIPHIDSVLHIQHLFPHGGVVLLTEDFICRETELALNVLDWFKETLERKSPGTWKLFFRPNVQFWMLDLCNQWPDDSMWQLYFKIKELDPDYPVGHYNSYRRPESPLSLDGLEDDEGQHHPFISTRYLPDYGTRRESDHPNIPRGLSQDERSSDHLVEFFAGWTLMNVDKFRKFYVITSFTPQPRWKEWSHIEVVNHVEFEKNIQDEQRSRAKHHSSTSSRRRGDYTPSDSSPSTSIEQQSAPLKNGLPPPPPPPPTP